MATTRPFAYNTGSPISGTSQTGDLAVGMSPSLRYDQDPGGVTWYMGCDEDLGFVIGLPVPGNQKPTFLRSVDFTDQAYLDLVNVISEREGGPVHNNATDAANWINEQEFWQTYTGGTVEPPAPEACWTFEEASGTIYDQTANNNDVSTTNLITYQVPGKIGDAVDFYDEDSYAEGGSGLDLATGLTVSAWVKFTGSSTNWRTIYSKEDSIEGIIVFMYPSGRLGAGVYNSGILHTGDSGVAQANDGSWHHIAATFENTGPNTLLKLYLDGNLAKSTASGNIMEDATNNYRIGARSSASDYGFQGQIDCMTIYNEPLSLSQVKYLYNSGDGLNCATT